MSAKRTHFSIDAVHSQPGYSPQPSALFCERLRICMDALCLGPDDLASLLGSCRQTVRLWASGERDPQPNSIINIARLMDVPAPDLAGPRIPVQRIDEEALDLALDRYDRDRKWLARALGVPTKTLDKLIYGKAPVPGQIIERMGYILQCDPWDLIMVRKRAIAHIEEAVRTVADNVEDLSASQMLKVIDAIDSWYAANDVIFLDLRKPEQKTA